MSLVSPLRLLAAISPSVNLQEINSSKPAKFLLKPFRSSTPDFRGKLSSKSISSVVTDDGSVRRKMPRQVKSRSRNLASDSIRSGDPI
ncbi:hypothetical protein Nwi_0919 [Nitrobacter winogradskyi Nb-255]|uniref:Uncharacterized protein n=1 Tax=Nitrobacter winogradskyi (strain ATCC 25391 / DSM 10237 / CIP 104748 / NCIMB 11846 / Nb-255) TaxID=323098 RepID=Q3SU60_NITWN|nr:hypothetical protein Nwi_0919 [Nitrobacter winogradskyi Nb-255]